MPSTNAGLGLLRDSHGRLTIIRLGPATADGQHRRSPAIPLTRLKEASISQDGVRFLMTDDDGSTVACRVSHEALRDHASRVRFVGTDVEVFEAYRNLIERVASNAYDAGERFDDQGRVLVTSEALGRAWASTR
jgi:uncharacterized protein DUF1488